MLSFKHKNKTKIMKNEQILYHPPYQEDFFDKPENREKEKEKGLVKRLDQLLKKGASKGTIASCLSFSDTPEAWDLREKILETTKNYGANEQKTLKGDLAVGLAGLDDELAWSWRDKFIKEGVDLNALALSLRGLESASAWALRQKIKKDLSGEDERYRNSPTLSKSLFLSLIGLDSEDSWQMRKYLLEHGGEPQHYVLSLIGTKSPRAQEKRQYYFNQAHLYEGQNLFNSLMLSTIGQNDDFSEKLKKEFIKTKGDHESLLDSLATDDSFEAQKIREKYHQKFIKKENLEEKQLALHLGLSLAGLEGEKAEAIRDDLMDKAYYNEVAYSLSGDILSSYPVNQKQNS